MTVPIFTTTSNDRGKFYVERAWFCGQTCRRRKRELKIEPCHELYKCLRDLHLSHLPPLFLFSFFFLVSLLHKLLLLFPTAKIPKICEISVRKTFYLPIFFDNLHGISQFKLSVLYLHFCDLVLSVFSKYNAVNIFFTSKNEQDGYVWKIDKTDVRDGIYT